mmetsp:Transcript_101251/g.294850  ORF Transcript_101251/g.294850 Transcript_101251/m.294850 type:complete len:206 (+) Transcript_101251:664-1281(+)
MLRFIHSHGQLGEAARSSQGTKRFNIQGKVAKWRLVGGDTWPRDPTASYRGVVRGAQQDDPLHGPRVEPRVGRGGHGARVVEAGVGHDGGPEARGGRRALRILPAQQLADGLLQLPAVPRVPRAGVRRPPPQRRRGLPAGACKRTMPRCVSILLPTLPASAAEPRALVERPRLGDGTLCGLLPAVVTGVRGHLRQPGAKGEAGAH